MPRIESFYTQDAELCLVAFGTAARVARSVVYMAREEGLNVGLLRPITLYPFPQKPIQDLAQKRVRFLVLEMNLGQMLHPVKEVACKHCEVISAPKIGGEMHLPMELYKYLEGK